MRYYIHNTHFANNNIKNYLFDILHPLGHLLVAHVVDILDEGVVLLPEGHPEAGGRAEIVTVRACCARVCETSQIS